MTLPEGLRTAILQRLAEVERSEEVRILLAIESGSRAWGFESSNSDYDVRFIYCRREPWYLSIDVEAKRDVLEYPIVDEIDLNGWDLRKALRLLRESNPTIVEWLQSPIEYVSRGAFRSRALALLPEAYLPGKGIYHYRSMAKSAFRDFQGREPVRLKKYFYALRPLLASRWLETHGRAAPIEFEKLLATIAGHDDLLAEIERLLVRKRAGAELDLGPAIPRIDEFIGTEIARLEALAPDAAKRTTTEPFDTLFRAVLAEAWEG